MVLGGQVDRRDVARRERTGPVTLPMPDEWRDWLRQLRRGEHTKEEALAAVEDLEAQLATLLHTSHLPEPARAAADAWLVEVYRPTWES